MDLNKVRNFSWRINMSKRPLWKRNFNPNILLHKINEHKIVKPDEKGVSFKSTFDYHVSSASLYNMLEFVPDFTFSQNRRLLNKSIYNVAKEYELTAGDFKFWTYKSFVRKNLQHKNQNIIS